MNFNTLRASLVAAALTLGASLPTQAAMLTWNLSGVQFDDGTIATGSIKMDFSEYAWKVDSFSVSTFNGALSGFTYDNSNSDLINTSLNGTNGFYLIDRSVGRYFNFGFTAPLAAAGGEVAFNTRISYECMNCSPQRLVTAGSLTTLYAAEVPEPSTGALLLPTLAMMGWMARRRKHLVAK